MRYLLAAHIFATFAMTGLIWFVQGVHYPIFAFVPNDAFVDFENAHTQFTGYIVFPVMLIELGSAIALLFFSGNTISRKLRIWNLALVLIIWASTFLIQVPIHQSLSIGYSTEAQEMLVLSNWLRTALWTVRSSLFVIWLSRKLA